MTAIDRRPLPCIIEALDDNGLEGIQKNFEAIFAENTMGFRLEELEAALGDLATAQSIILVQDDGTISVSSTAILATIGGTGLSSFAVGDLLFADTTTTLASLAGVATGNALISGGVGVAPTWGKIDLTTHVSGDLPYANLTPATAASLLFGRGSAAGGGDWQEITLGGNLTMTGTVLDATGGGSGLTQPEILARVSLRG